MTPVTRLVRAASSTLIAACALLPVAPAAGEPVLPPPAGGLVIHGPERTLRDFCVVQDGRLWLVLPGGARHELVTSTSDSVIANPGDGSFHPFEEAEVQAALAALRHPLAPVQAQVFLLPYPRRAGLESAAGPGLILLSPGVRPLTREHQHAEFVHELGHVVQYARMPEPAVEAWTRYRELRGITDLELYSASAPHAYRPREIFAEDFRALIGGSLANHSGSIENASLAPPATVAGLEEFMRGVAAAAEPVAAFPLTCYPNPSRGEVRFARSGGEAAALDLYDAAGRRVASLEPAAAGGAFTWHWDGRDRNGAMVGAGVFFARPRAGGTTLRVMRLP